MVMLCKKNETCYKKCFSKKCHFICVKIYQGCMYYFEARTYMLPKIKIFAPQNYDMFDRYTNSNIDSNGTHVNTAVSSAKTWMELRYPASPSR